MKLTFTRTPGIFGGGTDVCTEGGNVLLRIKAKLSLGQCFCLYDSSDKELLVIKGVTPTFLSRIWTQFDIYEGNAYLGMIKKNIPFSKPLFAINYQGLYIDGNPIKDEFRIANSSKKIIATVKRIVHYEAKYEYIIDTPSVEDMLSVLVVTFIVHLGVDAPAPAGGG